MNPVKALQEQWLRASNDGRRPTKCWQREQRGGRHLNQTRLQDITSLRTLFATWFNRAIAKWEERRYEQEAPRRELHAQHMQAQHAKWFPE